MRKISKKTITQEILFETDDGKKYQYEGLAIEHDLECLENKMDDLKIGNINISDLNLTGGIYKVRTKNDFSLIEKYCEMKDFSLKPFDIPQNIIITDNFVVAVEDLRKVVTNLEEM